MTVEVSCSFLDLDAPDAPVLVRVGVVEDGLRYFDGHPAECVDDIDKPIKRDQGVVVDRDSEHFTYRPLDGVDRWVVGTGKIFRILNTGLIEVGNQAGETVTVPHPHTLGEGYIGQIPGHREHRRVSGRWVDADDDGRICAKPSPALAGVGAKQKKVETVQTVPQRWVGRGRCLIRACGRCDDTGSSRRVIGGGRLRREHRVDEACLDDDEIAK